MNGGTDEKRRCTFNKIKLHNKIKDNLISGFLIYSFNGLFFQRALFF